MSNRLKLYLYIIAVTLVVMLGVGVVIGAFAVGPAIASPSAAAPPTDGEAQYHRGIYDVCRSIMQGSRDQCLQAVAQAHDHHWYEQDSNGWSWPVTAGGK